MDRVSLDDPAAVAAADPGRMLDAVAGLGGQLRRGFTIGTRPSAGGDEHPSIVVVCGMGGSGIAGDVVRSLMVDRSEIPVVVVKGDRLPAFCGPRSLVFAVSYSGNTEETLSAHREAVQRGCQVVAVGSGGALQAQARRAAQPGVVLPDDVTMPRAALGYLAGAILGWLDREGTLGLERETSTGAEALDAMAARWHPTEPASENEAKSLARWLLGRTPVVWGSEGLMESAALRFKNQLNENAKVPAFCSLLPELDHNEVEGWSVGTGEAFAVVALRHDGEPARLAETFGATIEAVGDSGLSIREVRVAGSSDLERLFGTILLGDFASVYLGILRGVDPTPIRVITSLKERLSR